MGRALKINKYINRLTDRQETRDENAVMISISHFFILKVFFLTPSYYASCSLILDKESCLEMLPKRENWLKNFYFKIRTELNTNIITEQTEDNNSCFSSRLFFFVQTFLKVKIKSQNSGLGAVLWWVQNGEVVDAGLILRCVYDRWLMNKVQLKIKPAPGGLSFE